MFNGSELKKTLATLSSLDKKQNMTLIDSSTARKYSSYTLITNVSPSKLFATKNWSSNIRENSFENQVQISSKLEDKLKLTKQLSVGSANVQSSLNINVHDRPSTSISLPIKEKEYFNDSNHVKNPSLPIVSTSAKQIKVKSLSPETKEPEQKLYCEDDNLDLNPISIVINSPNKYNGQTTNSNLDYFINLASNPFTTKFEIIGPAIKNPNSSKSLSPPASYCSNQYLSNIRVPTRSNSANNLNYIQVKQDQSNADYVNINNTPDQTSFKIAKSISDENLNEDTKNKDSKTNFLQITDKIFTGNMCSIKNERKMCKYNIEYLIDMTDMRPEDLNRQTLGKLPCLCKIPHSRTTLSIELTDKSFKNLFIAFSEVNKLIQRAKKNNKCVLIFGKEHLSHQVVCACSQYLMVDYQMDMKTALKTILRKDYKLADLDKWLINYLEQLEEYLKHLSVNIQFNFSYLPSMTSKLNKAKIVYKPCDDFSHSVSDKTCLDYCNISDEDEMVQFDGKKKYSEKKSTMELLNDSDGFRFKSRKKSVSFSKLKNAESSASNSPTKNDGFKMAWM